MKTIFFLVLFLFCYEAYSKTPIARVIKLKGEATALFPGAMKARTVKKGDKFPKDTSLVTQDKSFLILKFNDGSRVTAGPSSQINVSSTKGQKKGVVSLLNGMIKAKVKKTQSAKNKLLIKTQTAAMGVRGTEFQTTYNAENKVTSLLTFDGEVAMAKMDKKDIKKNVANVEDVIEKKLDNKKEVSVVNKGKVSVAANHAKKVTEPVRIAPTQFAVLKKNETLGAEEVKVDKTELKKEVKKIEKEFAELAKKEEKAPEVETTPDKIKPRSGGYLDVKTGIYVQPPKGSVYDEKLKIYKANKDMGKIKADGSYVPPEGVKLDVVDGFVPDEEAAISDEKKEEIASKLNDNIKEQVESMNEDLRKEFGDTYSKYFL